MKRNKVLYLEVADKLKEDIFSGKYPVGTMLPTESELEEEFGVSKITIRKAIELLAADEYLEKKSGKGTTVISDRPYNRLSKAISFTQVLEKSNREVKKVTLSTNLIELTPEDRLYQYFGKQVFRLERLYLLDGAPYIHLIHYVTKELAGFSEEQIETTSLYRLLNKVGCDIATFKDSFQAIYLSGKQQEKLKTKDNIAIQRDRDSIDSSGNVLEYSRAIYNTSIHPYFIEYET